MIETKTDSVFCQKRNSSSKQGEIRSSGYPAPTFFSEAKQGIVEMPGMVGSGDNWAEHGFPWVKLDDGLGKSWWPHSVHNTRSSVI